MKKCLIGILTAVMLWGCAAVPQTPPKPTLPPSPYTPQDYVYEDGYLTCAAGQTVLGIDVSVHQGEIHWQQVADAGIEFVFVRLGNRGYKSGKLSADENALKNLAGAAQAGLLVGAYLYSQATSVEEAREEADFALKILGDIRLDLPVVFDWEYVSPEARTANVDARTLTDATAAFCQKVEAAGYESMVYFNASQGRDLLYLQELTQYHWWLAMYDIGTEFPCKVDMWQYTNTGSVPGISGNVDINLLFGDWGLGKELLY